MNLTCNMATRELVPKAPIDFLSELDRVTQKIIFSIIEKQRNAVIGDRLSFYSDSLKEKKEVCFFINL